MEKNQRNPRRRLNSLILLVAFTAVMLIVSTYAWFSAQKTVTVGNLEGKVNVAEGIEISLDAVNWSQEIDFSKFHVASGDIGEYTGLASAYPVNGATGTVHNILPSELIPVSTTGTEFVTNTETSGQEIAMFNGKNTEGIQLKEIIATDPTEDGATEAKFAGYYAIDLFLRNSSKIEEGETQGQTRETLQLNTNSNLQLVDGGSTTTGLQNTVRVALALYEPDLTTAGTSVSVTETDQAKILKALTGDKAVISNVAIWEPNADQHVTEILTNNNKITWSDADANLYLTTSVESATGADRLDLASGKGSKVQEGEMTPTYGLLNAATVTGTTISDIYNWNGTTNSTTLKKQIALQTKYSETANNFTTVDGGVRNLINSWGSWDSTPDSDRTAKPWKYPKASTGADIYEFGYGANTTASDVATGSGITAETGAQEFQIY